MTATARAGLTLWLLVAAAAPAQSAKELNARGYRLYLERRLPEALELFRRATETDPAFALGHYNHAATLGALRKQGKVCEHGAYKSAILEGLGRAVALDRRRLARAKRDPDFDPVRDTLGWQRLLGRDPARAQDARAIVEAVTWYAPPAGPYGPPSSLDFQPRGRLRGWRKVMGPQDAAPRTLRLQGTWRMKGFGVTLELRHPIDGQAGFEGTLEPSGRLVFPPPIGTLSDEMVECEG